MKKIIIALAVTAVSFTSFSAHAGGFGKKGGSSIGVNVSPTVKVGDVTALSGILNNNAIASGNTVSGILNGNATSLLSGNVLGVLGGGNSYKIKKH